MQYWSFGGSILPCINPAFLSSARCCETVEFARGNSFDISVKRHVSSEARCFIIPILAGCPSALANRAILISSGG